MIPSFVSKGKIHVDISEVHSCSLLEVPELNHPIQQIAYLAKAVLMDVVESDTISINGKALCNT